LLLGSGKGSFDSCEEELRDYLRDHRLGSTVAFAGEVDNVHEYLQASDIFVFPSEYEGFSLAIVEAMFSGLPVVATRVGSAPELIEDRYNGLLIGPKDAAELRAAIEWLLENRERWATMGERARESVLDRYRIESVADKHLDVLSRPLFEAATASGDGIWGENRTQGLG
jgi:glycosyltransferase involved in cell wall biosynthesis